MSLIESLNSFFKDADIKNVNLEHVLHFIKAENGEDTILNEFWYDLLKKSCKDNMFYIEDFCDLFNNVRFCENDVEKFLDSEYSGNKEILINDIINVRTSILICC